MGTLADQQSKHIERNGVRLGYVVQGHERGPAVMLCHGLLGDGRLWDGITDTLLTNTVLTDTVSSQYRLIIPDLRGHGASPAPGSFSLWDVAEDLLAILDAEGISAAAMIGFSMGGMAALRAALCAPERVTALALISTTACAEPLLSRLRNLTMAGVVGMMGPVRFLQPIATRLMFSPRFRREHPDVVRDALAGYRDQQGASLRYAIRAVFNRDDIVQRVEVLDAPTLIIVGDGDINTPPAWSIQLKSHLINSRLELLSHAGHMVPLERPDKTARLLRTFLASLPPRLPPSSPNNRTAPSPIRSHTDMNRADVNRAVDASVTPFPYPPEVSTPS